ncbi:hypothetical protein F511_13049 [Dorcoceras hygrometricum]|uniref:Uncharacterized protein n=1 Tax=Dorcoceras hygrometricum TaxID=472368 RepID=A0A2Z7BB13_9LAMI|nr:hypothetical protein F511_13049 [Dorcoceras hygrometricum]
MEDEKLAAYYDELTRKGGGAARFKQGLGFSSSANDGVPSRGSALPTSASSFLSSFVRASSPSKSSQLEKEAQLQSIQDKLSKKPTEKIRDQSRSPVRDRSRDRHSRRRSKSRSGSRDRHKRRRSSSRSPSRDEQSSRRSRDRLSRRRSRSRSRDRYSRRRSTSRDRVSRPRSGERSQRSGSPVKGKKQKEVRDGGRKEGRIDFAKLIEGYDRMVSIAVENSFLSERVKAKMKLQLSKTGNDVLPQFSASDVQIHVICCMIAQKIALWCSENDETMGKGSGWERFDFNTDAPLDDEEVEAGEDDAAVVKHIGHSFRFAAVERRREEEIKAAHDEAMFGASSFPQPAKTNDEREDGPLEEIVDTAPESNLLSDQVLTLQQGSWRDRARKT